MLMLWLLAVVVLVDHGLLVVHVVVGVGLLVVVVVVGDHRGLLVVHGEAVAVVFAVVVGW